MIAEQNTQIWWQKLNLMIPHMSLDLRIQFAHSKLSYFTRIYEKS